MPSIKIRAKGGDGVPKLTLLEHVGVDGLSTIGVQARDGQGIPKLTLLEQVGRNAKCEDMG